MYVHKIFDDVTKPRLRSSMQLTNTELETTTFTMQNVMELLQYAESKNCAFLKESALDFIALNKVEAIEKLSFNDAPGTIAKDILIALSRGDKNEDELTTMRISKL